MIVPAWRKSALGGQTVLADEVQTVAPVTVAIEIAVHVFVAAYIPYKIVAP